MKLHQVAVPASDLARAVGFYRDLLSSEPIAVFDPPGLAFFPLGETRLLVDAAGEDDGRPALLYLEVDDVTAAIAALRSKGVEVHTEPHVIFPDADGLFGPPGEDEWLAFVRDTEGNLVGLAGRRPSV